MPLLADEFFLLAHHDVTGRARLHPRAVGLGLASAVLAELVTAQAVAVDAGHVWVVDPAAPADALGRSALRLLLDEPEHTSLRVWLTVLSERAPDHVAQRLTAAGVVRPEQVRRLMRTRTIYVPVDINLAAWPWARLSLRLRRMEPLDEPDLFLAGLAAATGLDAYLLDGAEPEVARHLDVLLRALRPALRDLLGRTGAAVGNAVLSGRT
ncbi:GPP34 family phosphoprotein [Solwaraspora sp. WMMA2080]|uniref:GOLPH3/VPS74 family protein n=1 Tax=unclassified Solwaraspora TaxID=2627926 RepID=UPI00248CB359|nr:MULTISPECIES: GPP34 family phosphoprotein [unclassified Solwaraspora]WBB98047.1 GPP34 family phosphoprotein [Solwaraspora sp. WMMA2059]WBC23399.1 GPP34 family phosphoprotein [Solwaraspora sp. WMMA2080]